MLRDDDEFEPEYDCPVCFRRFGSHGSLEDHLAAEHSSPRQRRQCGKQLRDGCVPPLCKAWSVALVGFF